MIKCIQNLIKFRPSILKILSKKPISDIYQGAYKLCIPWSPSGPKFKTLSRFCWVFLVYLKKMEKIQSKNVGARVFTTIFSDVQGHITLVGGGIWPKILNSFKLFMHVPRLPARMRSIQSKNEGARVFHKILPLYIYGDFFPDAQGAVNSPVPWSDLGRIFELV